MYVREYTFEDSKETYDIAWKGAAPEIAGPGPLKAVIVKSTGKAGTDVVVDVGGKHYTFANPKNKALSECDRNLAVEKEKCLSLEGDQSKKDFAIKAEMEEMITALTTAVSHWYEQWLLISACRLLICLPACLTACPHVC